jgi:(5-formylfuran-3-yl)methyl phosphate synthase
LKLLISTINEQEAQEAIVGGADIIDVKNPFEGPLGASFPWVIKKIKESVAKPVLVSCTIGEMPKKPCSMALAAFGAASLGVDYVKVGLADLPTLNEAVLLLESITKAVKDCNPKIKVVAAGYADNENSGSLAPLLIPKAVFKAKADVAMIDTYQKDGKTLLDHLTEAELKKFVQSTHKFGLQAALAGSLTKEQVPKIYALNTDIVGLRGAACSNNNRLTGQVIKAKVLELSNLLKMA